jgi:glycosyltransferase involved in cell wall biosynthesis
LREVIVLDDASTDGSVQEVSRVVAAEQRVVRVQVNDVNTGSPFKQWLTGTNLAIGDYVWIAEADDLADPVFLERIINQMQRAGSVLGFTDSRRIDQDGKGLGDSYKQYINEIEPGSFDEGFDMDGPEFLARFLSVKNVILNVSGVVVQKRAMLDAFASVGEELNGYRVAGDWRLYVEICAKMGSRISYLPDALNTHRRHKVSVTHELKAEKHLAEIDEVHRVVSEKVVLSEDARRLQKRHLEFCASYLRGYE